MEPGDRLATLGREVLGADVSLWARREILYVGQVGAATSSVNRRFNADDKNGFFSELKRKRGVKSVHTIVGGVGRARPVRFSDPGVLLLMILLMTPISLLLRAAPPRVRQRTYRSAQAARLQLARELCNHSPFLSSGRSRQGDRERFLDG